MTIEFHRLTVPTYFGGLPAGYDYVNNAVSGTPADANGVLTYGPNIGSYFIGFGDDATSADGNRPAQALSQNTDFLDNLLHTDLVQMVRTADQTVSGSPQTSITLTATAGTIWLGSGGYALQDLFHITDSLGRDINVSGAKIVVSAISSGGSLGGGFASGTAVTLMLNTGIPVGTAWHMYYCSRTNLATLPIDAMTLPFMRDIESVQWTVSDFIAQISEPGTLGSAVTTLQAYSFSTPYSRLAATSIFDLDCDPTDSGATYRVFNFRTRHQSVNRQLGVFYDDPTSSLWGPGLTGLFQVDTGVGFGSAGTFLFEDANLRSGGGGTGMDLLWPLTSSTVGNGDQFPRLFEMPVNATALGGTVNPSILSYINGRWCCTCGDGTLSFGDFNGAGSINAAFAYAASIGINNIHIQLKRGNYTVATGLSWSAGGVIIEGVDPGQTTISGEVSSGTAIFEFGGPHLELRDLTMTYVSGAQLAISCTSGSSLFMDDVQIVNMGVQMVDSSTYDNVAAVYCRRCRFAPTTAGLIAMDLQFTTNAGVAHNGYYFDECAWFCADETRVCRILGASTNFQTLNRIRFQACNYTLGGTATTSSHLTHNTGVIEINPNGGNGRLIVNDMEWIDCFPVSSTGAANAPLARIYSIALGDNVGTNLAIIGRIEIRGGRWTANQTAAGATISPFLIAAQEIVVDDVIFVGCALTSGGQSSEDVNLIDGNTYAAADWAQFIFAPGAQTVSGSTNDIRMSMTHCSFRNFNQLSNSGDIWFILGNYTQIDGVVVTDYNNSGGGSAPNTRVRVQLGNNNSSRPYGITGGGGIKNFVMYPGASVNITSGDYTNSTQSGGAAIFMLMPMVYSPSFDQDPFVIDHLNIQGFIGNTGDDDLVVLSNLTSYGGLTNTVGWFYTLKDCTLIGGHFNLIQYGWQTSSPVSNGDNGLVLSGLSIIRGEYCNARQAGITLNPDYVGDVLLDGVRAKKNTTIGFRFNPKNWANSGQNYNVCVVNCKFWDNLGTAQCQFISNQTADVPNITFKGNSCQVNGVQDKAQFQSGNNASIAGTATPGSGFFFYGVETGFGTVGSSNQPMLYASGSHMVENIALLLTP
jgi:hypothetical protein